MKINEVKQFSKLFDHTLLKEETTLPVIKDFVKETIEGNFRGIVVPGYYVPQIIDDLEGTDIGIVTGTSYPYGNDTTEVKKAYFSYWKTLGDRITDLEVINNVCAVKDQRWDYLKEEMETMVDSAGDKTTKYLIETPLLTTDEIKKVVEIAMSVDGLDYIKTATGYNGPTTYEHVKTIYSITGGKKKIKVAGGVKTLEQVETYLELGANVFGSSSSMKILREYNETYGRKNK